MERIIRRQVPESDPVYQTQREKDRASEESKIFGVDQLASYERVTRLYNSTLTQNAELATQLEHVADKDPLLVDGLTKRIEENNKDANTFLKERREYLRTPFEELMKELNLLFLEPGYENKKQYVLSHLRTMFAGTEIRAELKKYFGEDLSKFTVYNVLLKTIDKSLSDELIYRVTRAHVEAVRKEEIRLQEVASKTKVEFKKEILEAVATGYLPKAAEVALERITSLPICLSDTLLSARSLTAGENTSSRVIRISNEELQEDSMPRVRKILFHELMHEISGKSTTVKTATTASKFDGTQNQSHSSFHRKSGISLSDPSMWHSTNT
jgi:hypothetical protein